MRKGLPGEDAKIYPPSAKSIIQELVSSWPCSSCGEVISPDGHDALMVGDVRFHHDCLQCQVCHQNMEGKAVTLDKDNRVYCTEDYNR